MELAIQVEHRLRVGTGRFDLAPVANQALVQDEAIDVVRRKVCQVFRIKVVERRTCAGLLGLDHTPADAGLEYRLGKDVQVICQLCRTNALRALHGCTLLAFKRLASLVPRA